MNVTPEKSVRQLKRECERNVSESSIFKTFEKELKLRPWKPHYVQKLENDDNARRLIYAIRIMDTRLQRMRTKLQFSCFY